MSKVLSRGNRAKRDYIWSMDVEDYELSGHLVNYFLSFWTKEGEFVSIHTNWEEDALEAGVKYCYLSRIRSLR